MKKPTRQTKKAPERFRDVLKRNMKLFAKKGFKSKTQLKDAIWEIEQAAKRASVIYGDDSLVANKMNDSFKELMGKGRNSLSETMDIETIDAKKLSPTLQAELRKRIWFATDYAKENREEAVDAVLKRFVGWAGAIQPGLEVRTAEAEREIYKPLTQLPWMQRRLAIDQTSKLQGAVKEIVASKNGAIAAFWHARAGRVNYTHRPEHEAIDGHFFAVKDGWAYQQGLIKKGDAFTENIGSVTGHEIDGPGILPFCNCVFHYIFSLDDIPGEYLTAKGIKEKYG